MAEKQAFGGYAIDFKGCTETIEEVMGTEDISPAQMTKKLWDYVKEHDLGTKP